MRRHAFNPNSHDGEVTVGGIAAWADTDREYTKVRLSGRAVVRPELVEANEV